MSARDGPRVAIGHNLPHAVGAFNCPTIVSCVSFRCSFEESDEPTSLPQWAVMELVPKVGDVLVQAAAI